jgi:radical SAM protein (TIGR01212 family)
MNSLYYSFSQYLKNKYNKKVYKICIDAGFTCPNRNGLKATKGCIYCNNDAFTQIKRKTYPSQIINNYLPSIEEQIKKSKEKLISRFKAEAFILYFQPYSNTYAPLNELRKLYDYVYSDNDIIGLSIGTRPDCVNEEIITLISEYNKDKEVWIEYGLETANDKTLELINRKHTFSNFLNAINLTSKYKINICVHIIFGLPYETQQDMLTTVKHISKLPIHAVKFHPLHIVKGSLLGDYGFLVSNKWIAEIPISFYKNIPHSFYQLINDETETIKIEVDLLSMDQYVDIVCKSLDILPKNIIIQRLTGEATPDLLLAPDWINNKYLTLQKINEELKKRSYKT